MRILKGNGSVCVWVDIEYSHRKGQAGTADVEDFALSESPVMAHLVLSCIGLAGRQGASGVLV
jgi:hypothetical protein